LFWQTIKDLFVSANDAVFLGIVGIRLCCGEVTRQTEQLLCSRYPHCEQQQINKNCRYQFAPLYQDAAKAHRHCVDQRWSVDETYVKVAGRWAYIYRAIDEYGQVVDVLFREHRDSEVAVASFCLSVISRLCM
jgi:transposase-like protein